MITWLLEYSKRESYGVGEDRYAYLYLNTLRGKTLSKNSKWDWVTGKSGDRVHLPDCK
jgi:hypothetical protein